MNKAQEYFKQELDKGNVKEFKKFGNFIVTKAVEGQRIATVINGVVETTNVAKADDWLVTGVHGEQYLIDDKKLQSRYKFVANTPKGPKYKAVGKCFAVKYYGPSITFTAPWGEQMICDEGDFICSTAKDKLDDIYRIEKSAFMNTYKPA